MKFQPQYGTERQWPTVAWIVSRARRVIAATLLGLAMAACSRPSPQSKIDRLSDREPGDFQHFADGTWHRVLDPSRSEHSFTITDAAPGAHLLVSPGIDDNSPPGSVLFEVTWKNGDQDAATLYRHELTGPGWVDEDVELPGAGSGELRLRTTPAAGSEAVLPHAGWGDPVLRSGDAPPRPSVILVSLDTLRADRLGVYGRSEARTPALDGLARSAVWYDQAYSSSTWTRPSHQSLLYGIQPWALGATRFGDGSPTNWSFAGFASLADAFRGAGYATAAFTGGGFVSARYGLSRGFDTYYAYPGKSGDPDACDPSRFDGREVFARTARWLRQRAGTPFFLFVHTYEPHDRCPVRAPRDRSTFKPPAYSPAKRTALVKYYDDVVARTDELVAGLLRELDSLGLADTTLLAITSDHGEALWEHRFVGHGCDAPPYEELARVPLIVRLPQSLRRTRRIEAPVSTIDVAPTLLALAGIPVPGTMQGEALPGLGLGSGAERPVYVHCGEWLSVRKGDLTFLVSQRSRSRMLFNTRDDPAQLVDLVGDRSADKDALRELARHYWARVRDQGRDTAAPVPTQAIDPADRERLRALGYGG